MSERKNRRIEARLKSTKGSDLNAAAVRLMNEFREEYHGNLTVNRELGTVEHSEEQEKYIVMVADQLDTRWLSFCKRMKNASKEMSKRKLDYTFIRKQIDDYIQGFIDRIALSWVKAGHDSLKELFGWDAGVVEKYGELINKYHGNMDLGQAVTYTFADAVAQALRDRYEYSDKMMLKAHINYELGHEDCVQDIRRQYKEYIHASQIRQPA
jgi:hypothetical protein